MTRTIPELDALINEAETTLYALYAERRQLRKDTKPNKNRLMGKALEKLVVSHFRTGMVPNDIAQTLSIQVGTVRNHINTAAFEMAYALKPWDEAISVFDPAWNVLWKEHTLLAKQLKKNHLKSP